MILRFLLLLSVCAGSAVAVATATGCCATRAAVLPKDAAARPAVPDDFDPALLRRAGVEPQALRCNRENRWGGTTHEDAVAAAAELFGALGPALHFRSEEERAALTKTAERLVFWRLVRSVLLEGNNNNLGVVALRGLSYRDAQGQERPVLLFRSGFTPGPDAAGSCFGSLLGAGGVRHVVNLFDGGLPSADLVEREQRTARARGASYTTASDDPAGYGPWRDLVRQHYDEPEPRRRAMDGVARLIRDQILRPGGAPPRGNIHIHCAGGMHRSGMVTGVIERCVNGEPLSVVEAHYRYHVGYRDPQHAGGLEEGNLRFIRDFDCGLLKTAAGAAASGTGS